jgi:hypothetical protein
MSNPIPLQDVRHARKGNGLLRGWDQYSSRALMRQFDGYRLTFSE